jgi:hypothetical protein
MDITPNLSLPLIAAAQAQKHVTHNEAVTVLDALVQLSVADRTRSAPPENPGEGDRHIVAGAALAEWTGWEDSIAVFSGGEWVRMHPRPGWSAWIKSEGQITVWDGNAWQTHNAIGNPLLLGINTLADTDNRLAVKSDGVLFSHDDVTPGSGDFRLAANKLAPEQTASLVFNTGWSGRAELGLTGSDAFSIKVSADGATWIEALSIDPLTGAVTLPATSTGLKVFTAEDTSGTLMPHVVYTDQVFAATTRNDFGPSAWNGSLFTVPEDGTYDFGASLAVNGTPSATSMYFFKNGTSQLGFSEISGVPGQNTIVSRAVLTLSAGDTVSVRMRHDAGSAQSGLAAALYSIVRL